LAAEDRFRGFRHTRCLGLAGSRRVADAFGAALIDALKPILEKSDVRGEVGFVRMILATAVTGR